jgi:hypothetical protein
MIDNSGPADRYRSVGAAPPQRGAPLGAAATRWPADLVIEEVSPEETLEQAAAMVGYEAFRERAGRSPPGKVGTWVMGIALYIEPQPGMGPYGVGARAHP